MTTSELVRIERDGAVAIVRLVAGRANAMSDALLAALRAAIDEVDAPGTRAIVVTGDGRAFSAGLALPDLIDRDRPAMGAFIDRFADVMERVLAARRPTIAAIDGHAIAGGCVLALMCDRRVMAAGPARIGLNEVQLGIGLPAIVTEALRARVPPAAWPPLALDGRLVDADAALRLGLVDEVVPAADLDARARALAAELAAVPAAAYAQVKEAWIRPVRAALRANEVVQTETWLDTWFDPEGQERLRAAVARITRIPRT